MERAYILLVREWHMKFNIHPPENVSDLASFIELRDKLFFEELKEYLDAGKDLIERADAIVDMMYIIAGSLELCDRADKKISRLLDSYVTKANTYLKMVELLTDLEENSLIKEKIKLLFIEVNDSNHTKADKDGNPIYREDGKLLKGEFFKEPQIKKVLFYEQ
jgi:Phosphoribosyl-ATP pyrophosphohydrolase